MKLVNCKNYFNLTKRQFRIVGNQTESSKHEQSSVIKLLGTKKCKPCEIYMGLSLQIEQRSFIIYLLAEKCKSCEIYRKMYDVYTEAYYSQKMFTNRINMGLSLQIEQRSFIIYLLAEKCKPCEIYRKMYDVYTEACFCLK